MFLALCKLIAVTDKPKNVEPRNARRATQARKHVVKYRPQPARLDVGGETVQVWQRHEDEEDGNTGRVCHAHELDADAERLEGVTQLRNLSLDGSADVVMASRVDGRQLREL